MEESNMPLKPFLSLNKVRQWYINNHPDKVLLAKLDDGTLPVRVIDDGVEQDVYLSFDDDDDNGRVELEVELIDDLKFKAVIDEDGDFPKKLHTRIFTQPEKDAWIEWK
jgi:hypothetical protein